MVQVHYQCFREPKQRGPSGQKENDNKVNVQMDKVKNDININDDGMLKVKAIK